MEGYVTNGTVLVLQSGGRDSTLSVVRLLEAGYGVVACTLAASAVDKVEIPKRRAQELSTKYTNYAWNMIDMTEWDEAIKSWVAERIPEPLPKSCLLCALSKITAIIPLCSERGIGKICLGYTQYQASWAEQTPYAIELQERYLQARGLDLLLPVRDLASKNDARSELLASDLSVDALENPCCISEWGTQTVPNQLIEKTIDLSFQFASANTPNIRIVSSLGGNEQ